MGEETDRGSTDVPTEAIGQYSLAEPFGPLQPSGQSDVYASRQKQAVHSIMSMAKTTICKFKIPAASDMAWAHRFVEQGSSAIRIYMQGLVKQLLMQVVA